MKLETYANKEIRDLVRKDLPLFDSGETVSRVYGELKEKDQYVALVKSGDKLGLATIRHLLDVKQPGQTTIGEHPKDRWSIHPTVSPGIKVMEATDKIIRKNIRALPVKEGNTPIGIISQVELTWGLEDVEEMKNIPVTDLMVYPVISMHRNESIANARKTMLKNNISHLVVLGDGGKPSGMLTAKELVYRFVRPIGSTTVGERIGTKTPRYSGKLFQVQDSESGLISVNDGETAYDAVKIMKRNNSSYCLVLDSKGELEGIITPRELLKPLLKYLPGLAEPPVYIVGLEADENWFDTVQAENKLKRVVNRGISIHPDIQEIRVKIERQRTKGQRTRYEARVNVYSKTPNKQIFFKEDEWDLLRLFDKISEDLDRLLREKKPEKNKMGQFDTLDKSRKRR